MKFHLQKFTLLLFFTAIAVSNAIAQDNLPRKQVNKVINAAQDELAKELVKTGIDNESKAMITRFIVGEIDSIQKSINKDKLLTEQQKVTALNCQEYLLENMKREIESKPLDVFQIHETRNTFIPLWENIRTGQSSGKIISGLGIKVANMMTDIFRDFPQSSEIKDMATFKNMQQSPEKIMGFLNDNPDFIFRDSLIYILANTQPERFIMSTTSIRDDKLSKAVHEHASPLVKTLLALANEKNIKNYLPFAGLLSQNKITLADIDKARSIPSNYYKLLVDAELDNQAMVIAGKRPVYRAPLKRYLKEYAITFYTDVINSLHEEPKEKARYFVLDDLRPQDLYFVLIGGENELYTSSYLYTYKKLMGMFQNNHYDSLLQLVNYDSYRKFMSLAGRYNTLSDFMKQMPQQVSVSILKRFMNSLENRQNSGLEETINVAETFPGIVKDKGLSELTSNEIQANFDRTKNANNYYGMKLYTVLKGIFTAVKGNELGDKSGLPPKLAVYYKVKHQDLRSKNGTINQLVLFYGDEDGKGSYNSFLTNFSDTKQWSIEKNANFLTIKSKKFYPISIYANLPLDNDRGLDVQAQDSLNAYLKREGISPNILIHRGHSYHLGNSIKSVTNTTTLAILGSCGGYSEIFDVLAISPTAQIISTKQVGSLQVNEPIIRLLNERLLNEKDLEWSGIWDQLNKQLKPNKIAYDYFQEYVPPYKNISLLVATLFDAVGTDTTPDELALAQ